MPAVLFNIRLDGKAEGCVRVSLQDGQSLKEARGTFTIAAGFIKRQAVLGEEQPQFPGGVRKFTCHDLQDLLSRKLLSN